MNLWDVEQVHTYNNEDSFAFQLSHACNYSHIYGSSNYQRFSILTHFVQVKKLKNILNRQELKV